jgi:anti-sigma B factor antagonist
VDEISLWVDTEARPMRVLASGELDLDGGDRLEALVSQLVGRGDDVALDLSAVSFMDSSGLGALISLAQGPGHVVLEDASPAVLRVMEVTGTVDVMELGPPALVRGRLHDVFHHPVAS